MLADHHVMTAYECGWQQLANGDLLVAAEAAGFEVLITTDKNLRYQQNLTGRGIAILVLSTTDWRRIRQHASLVAGAIQQIAPGAYSDLQIPAA